MKVLITGADGQVGRELVAKGAASGFTIVPYNRQLLDITNNEAVAAIFAHTQPDLVINAAAYTNVDEAEMLPDLAFAVNRDGPLNLARACAITNVPLFHISTDYVFRGDLQRPYRETDIIDPQGIYASSKESGEQQVRHSHAQHVILRTSWVFSKFEKNFVNTILNACTEKSILRVVNDQFGGPTSAASIARTLLKIARIYDKTGVVSWGTYHYSNMPHVTWYDFAKKIVELAYSEKKLKHKVVVQPISSSEFKTLVVRPTNSRLDGALLQKRFQIAPEFWSDELLSVIRSKNISS